MATELNWGQHQVPLSLPRENIHMLASNSSLGNGVYHIIGISRTYKSGGGFRHLRPRLLTQPCKRKCTQRTPCNWPPTTVYTMSSRHRIPQSTMRYLMRFTACIDGVLARTPFWIIYLKWKKQHCSAEIQSRYQNSVRLDVGFTTFI